MNKNMLPRTGRSEWTLRNAQMSICRPFALFQKGSATLKLQKAHPESRENERDRVGGWTQRHFHGGQGRKAGIQQMAGCWWQAKKNPQRQLYGDGIASDCL